MLCPPEAYYFSAFSGQWCGRSTKELETTALETDEEEDVDLDDDGEEEHNHDSNENDDEEEEQQQEGHVDYSSEEEELRKL